MSASVTQMWFKWNKVFNSDARTYMSTNDPNLAQMSLNKPKCAQMILNKTKWSHMSQTELIYI